MAGLTSFPDPFTFPRPFYVSPTLYGFPDPFMELRWT
jgi:hypothetical protein